MDKLFELASRKKLRFPFKGQCSVEDLWDLSVKELDSIFKALNKEAKQDEEESLLATKSTADTILEAKISIIKHIVAVKMDEVESAKKAKERSDKKQMLMELIADKENEALRNSSVDELKAMLAELA